ncbi:DUF2957 domain-containing protein [Cupriavidus necator]
MTMSMHRRSTLAFTGVSLAMTLAACGGGGGGDDAPRTATQTPPQCAATNTCPAQGPVTIGGPPGSLCPAALDYSITFTGGSGAGELVKLRFDTAARTYQLEIIESPVPKQPGSVSPTRAGVTFTGSFANLTSLPTAEQNRCAIALQTATASDGTSQANIDSARPPVIFLGNGVADGGIPGATISYPGVDLLDPMTMNQTGSFQLDFTQNAPGMVTTTDNSGVTGALIASGRVFGHLSGAGGASPTLRVDVLAAP